MPLGGLPLDGEHDCRLTLPFDTGSTDEDRTVGPPGRPLLAEIGLSVGSDVLRFGGASRENPGISEGFHGLGFTVGELDRTGTGFFAVLETNLVTDEEDGDLTGGADVIVAGLRVGVADLDIGFDAGIVGLAVGVDDLAEGLAVGVDDLGGTVGLAEGKVAREVGVADLEGLDMATDAALDVVVIDGFEPVVRAGLGAEIMVDLDVALKVGRPVGVEGLDPPDDEGLRSPALDVVNPGDEVACLDGKLFLTAVSTWGFANFNKENKLQNKITSTSTDANSGSIRYVLNHKES